MITERLHNELISKITDQSKIGDTFEVLKKNHKHKGVCVGTIVESDLSDLSKNIEFKFYQITLCGKKLLCSLDSELVKTTRIVLVEKESNKISKQDEHNAYFEMKKEMRTVVNSAIRPINGGGMFQYENSVRLKSIPALNNCINNNINPYLNQKNHEI